MYNEVLGSIPSTRKKMPLLISPAVTIAEAKTYPSSHSQMEKLRLSEHRGRIRT
jgi:hypothetical protein